MNTTLRIVNIWQRERERSYIHENIDIEKAIEKIRCIGIVSYILRFIYLYIYGIYIYMYVHFCVGHWISCLS